MRKDVHYNEINARSFKILAKSIGKWNKFHVNCLSFSFQTPCRVFLVLIPDIFESFRKQVPKEETIMVIGIATSTDPSTPASSIFMHKWCGGVREEDFVPFLKAVPVVSHIKCCYLSSRLLRKHCKPIFYLHFEGKISGWYNNLWFSSITWIVSSQQDPSVAWRHL